MVKETDPAVDDAVAAETMSAAPAESWTITNYYKQAVYDPKETKIGDIDDVLVDKAGKVTKIHVKEGETVQEGQLLAEVD